MKFGRVYFPLIPKKLLIPIDLQNFMKSLMKMFAEEDKGVIFYETVINLKWQRHTCIECVPLPWAQYDDIPQYFKVSIRIISKLQGMKRGIGIHTGI